MNRFDGNIVIGPKPQGEYEAAVAAYEACGFKIVDGLDQAMFIDVVGEPFLPNQLTPTQHLRGINEQTRGYIGKEVRPQLSRMIKAEDEKALTLGYRMGSLMAFGQMSSRIESTDSPIGISDSFVHAEGQDIPVNLGQAGRYVVDYGMGMIGLFPHIKNLREEKYQAFGLQKQLGEVVVLRGFRDRYGLSNEQVEFMALGVQGGIRELAKAGFNGHVDLIIASRVHEAGKDLEGGISPTSQLMRPGGVLVARGPRAFQAGIGYDKLRDLIKRTPGLSLTLDMPFMRKSPHGKLEQNRLIAAKKR